MKPTISKAGPQAAKTEVYAPPTPKVSRQTRAKYVVRESSVG